MSQISPMRDTSGQDIVLPPRSKLKRRMAIGSGVVVLALSVGMALPALSNLFTIGMSISRQQIRIATVVRGDLQHDIAAQGRVVAANSPTLYAPATGIISLKIKAGDAVTIDQLIASIDSPELTNQLEQERTTTDSLKLELDRHQIHTRSTLLNNQQAIEIAAVNLELAATNKLRADQTYKINLMSEVEYEHNIAQLRKAELEHRHAIDNLQLQQGNLESELQLKQLQYERQLFILKEWERKVEALTLRSPITGIVGSINIRDRDNVAINSALATLVDLTAFEVEVDIPENYADDMGVGLSAEVLINGETYLGELTAISPEVANGQVIGRIAFITRAANLRQNQRVSARILIESREDVLMLRRGAFVESGGGRVSYVVDGNIARRRNIQLGARSVANVEITNGLEEGEEVIISDIETFNRAEQVFISK